ncbi:MAG: hypothetical protein ACLQIB_24735 [Isosphaeraceae bacterium]
MPGNTAHEYEAREAVNEVVEASRKFLDTDERPVRRDQHPKQHGCVRARFIVAKNLGDPYRQGLFQEEKVYEAWIRLSNGSQWDDRKPDAHGMAVKLMGVEGPKVLASERDASTQDFVMVDNPTFFLRGAVEYSRYSQLLLKAKGKEPSSLYNALGLLVSGPLRGLLTLLVLSLLQGRLFTFLRLIRFASKRIANPVTTRYWSTTPYKFGDTCMKFSAVPAELPGGPPAEGPGDDSYTALADFLRPAVAALLVNTPPKGGSRDYLRDALARTLALRGAVFLFQVQLFRDDKTTPIDDPTVEWPEDAAPFQTVARIWIPRQVFDTPGRMAFGENLSFTPWHAIFAHEPLGEINAVRKVVYSKLSALRHRLNGVAEVEPAATDPDPANMPPRWGDDSSAFCHVLRDELDLIRQRRRQIEGPSAEGGDGEQGRPPEAGSAEQAELAIDGTSDPAATAGGRAVARDVDSLTRQVRLRALNEHTTGLALAGQGAKSAAFAVGLLQGLASLGLIRRLDYLSAVSGGGHAAAWLAAWLKREGGDPANVERQLAPSRIEQARAPRQYLATGEVVDEEPQPLRHLRSHARSLEHRAGILATDAGTSIPSWARNVMIHLFVLVLLLVLVAAGARLIVALYGLLGRLMQIDQLAAQFDSRLGGPVFVLGVLALGLILLAGALALGLAFSAIARSLHEVRGAEFRLRAEPDTSDPVALVQNRIVTRLLAAALLLSLCVPPIGQGLRELVGNLSFLPDSGGLFSLRTIADVVLAHFTLLGWPNFLAHAFLIGGVLAWWTSRRSAGQETPRRKTLRGASFAAGATGGLLIVLLEGLDRWFEQIGRPDLVATFVPALALLIVVAAMVVEVAALGRAAGDAERAWWAGVSALLTKLAIYWVAGMATILYLPGVVFAAGGITRAAGAAAWLGAGALGVIVGRHVLTRDESARSAWLTWLASVSALVFFAGLLGATALIVSFFANMPALTAPGGDDDGPFAYYLRGIEGTSILTLLMIALGAGILGTLARRLIDVNLFSLDALDAARLTRAHLGASRPIAAWQRRWSQPRDERESVGAPSLADPGREPVLPLRNPSPLTGMEPRDDIELSALRIGQKSDSDRTYWGPHLLVCTTQRTQNHSGTGWRTVDGESFLLSPLYCGSRSCGYARTENSKPAGAVDANLSLGRAMAISGTAAGLCIGSHTIGRLTALLTLFSARGGSWIEKPKSDGWAAASPRFSDLSVPASLGLAGGDDFVYLSGGAEFERLGVYELIRRRCRYIVAVDGGDGRAATEPGLATLIRRCRIEFGVRIEIDTRALEQPGPDGLSSAGVAIGQVHYGDVDPGGMPGVLVYITLEMTGDDSPDIPREARNEPRSRNERISFSDAFDDRQFERYRYLGNHAAGVVFGDVVSRLGARFPDLARQSHAEYVPQLFAAVVERWTGAAKTESEG